MNVPKTSATDTDYKLGILETQRTQVQSCQQPDIKNVEAPPKNFMAWLVKISHRQNPPELSKRQPPPNISQE